MMTKLLIILSFLMMALGCLIHRDIWVKGGWATLTKIEAKGRYDFPNKYFLTWQGDDGDEYVEWAADTLGVHLGQRIKVLR